MARIGSVWSRAMLCGVVLLAAGSRTPLRAQIWHPYQQQQLLLRQQMLYRQQMLVAQQRWLQQQAMQRMLYQQAAQQARLQALAQTPPPVVVPVAVVPPAADPPLNITPAPARGKSFTMSGSEDLAGYGALEFRFDGNGQVTMVDSDGSHRGTYTRSGARYTMHFYGGSVVYAGTRDGDTLTGTARNGKRTWNFNVSR